MKLARLKNDGKPELRLNQVQKSMKEQIEERINKKEYVFEEIDCPICKTDHCEKLGEKDRYGLYYPTVICKSCGLIYTKPRMTQDSYNKFYNSEYRKLYVGTESPSDSFFRAQQKKGKRIYNFLLDNNIINHKSLQVLEIGCGAGGILYHFKNNGHKVTGVDLGEEYLNFGIKNYNLDLHTGTLATLSINEKPDLIIYSHVLEHILDLQKEIELMKEHAHDKTAIYIEVPGIKEIHKNYKMNILRYFQNAHTYHFTLSTLKNLMIQHGFEFINGNEFVMSIFRNSCSDISSDITNDYPAVINYIEKNERKRRLYPFTINGLKSNIKKMIVKVRGYTKI